MVRRGIALIVAVGTCLAGCSQREPSRTASPRDPVVYLAELAPQYERLGDSKLPVLKAGATARLRFGVGLLKDTPVIVASRPVNPEIANSPRDLPLTMMLFCGFCDAQRTFMKDLLYRQATRGSNTVEFELSAGALPASVSELAGRLEITIFNDRTNVEYDHFVVDVLLRRVSDGAAPLFAPFGFDSAGESITPDSTADVTLYIHEDLRGLGVAVRVDPILPEAAAALSALRQPDGVWRTFSSSIDVATLQGISGTGFTRLSELSLQGGFVKQLRNVGIDATMTKTSQDGLTLQDSEAAAVHRVIGDVGQTLYRLLFEHGQEEDALGKAMRALESLAAKRPADRPLRLQVVSDLALPWQYLHPTGGPIDPHGFWGLRYSLSAQRINTGSRNRLLAPASAKKVVFARHAGTSDPTVALAELQIQQLAALPSDLLVVKSRDELLKRAMAEARADVSAIVAFTHGTSGKVLQQAGSAVFVLDEASGAALRFADNDIVTVAELLALPNQVPPGELAIKRYFPAGPLVVLNACESGGAAVALPQLRLQDALFQLGVQGIVTTEVSVWVKLGHAVGTKLIERLGQGQSAADALTLVRRDLYTNHRNALGLLYAYHGEPSLTLRR